jgi:hypothetical protein
VRPVVFRTVDWKVGVHTPPFTAVNVTTLKVCFNIFGSGYGHRPV